jgi:hypothetical protein
MSDGTNNNRIYTTAGTIEHLLVTTGGVNQAAIDAGAVTAGVTNKIGAALAANDFAAVISGGTVVTDTSGTVPTVSQMFIGNYNNSSSYLNGHIRQITYIPRRISNSELQARTTL